jgi:SAM-dependent methyltransferase
MLDFAAPDAIKSAMSPEKPDLNAAYALQSPEDNRRLYADWAQTYDSEFAARMSYRLPALVAAAFEGKGPVLDVGAGTGLLGQALAAKGVGPVDALDLSPEMLDVARGKGVYRQLLQADLTQPLTLPAGGYNGIVSSGTFTHGHVGPGAIAALLPLAVSGAHFVMSVNAGVYQTLGFDRVLAGLSDRISAPEVTEEAIYSDAPDAGHRGDKALILRFRLL